jgi:hypothetical protein
MTESAQSARFAETTSQISGAGSDAATELNFTSTSAGSIDFASDAISLRTRVIQAGLSPQEYMSVLVPGTLYERIGTPPFLPRIVDRWTKQPIAYDPILSIPGLAALRFDTASVDMHRVRDELVNSASTTEFRLVPNRQDLCTIPNGPRERLSTATTIWVDDQGRLRRITQVERVGMTYGGSEPSPRNVHFVTTSTVTFMDFGQGVPIDIPTKGLSSLVPRSPPTSTTSPHPLSCRNLTIGG